MRNDHLRLVTDAGAALDLGWDYGIPYQIDNLSGVDVTLKTAQGVNQQGVTVEGQSVEGCLTRSSSQISGGRMASGRQICFCKKLPFFTSGTAYFGDKYFSRFVLQKTPYTVQLHPYPPAGLSPLPPQALLVQPREPERRHGRLHPPLPVSRLLRQPPVQRVAAELLPQRAQPRGAAGAFSPRSSAPRVSWSTQPSATASPGSISALTPP